MRVCGGVKLVTLTSSGDEGKSTRIFPESHQGGALSFLPLNATLTMPILKHAHVYVYNMGWWGIGKLQHFDPLLLQQYSKCTVTW